MKYLMNNKVLVVLIILSIIFIPIALSKEAQGENEAIVIALGVDKDAREYEVSAQLLIPTPDAQFNQKINIVKAKGRDIAEALNLIEIRVGKPIGLVHCKTIVFGDNVCNENIIKIVDYVNRTRSNSNNISLVHTDEKASEFLNDSGDLNNSLHFVLNDNNYNKQSIYGTFTSLGDFYDSYFSEAGCCIMASIGLGKAQDIGGLGPEYDISGDQSAAGSDGGGGGQKDKKVTNNEGKSVIFKHGKKVRDMSLEDTAAVNWVNNSATIGTIRIENVDDELYDDATVNLTISRKKTKKRISIKNGRPYMKVDIGIVVGIEEIDSDSLKMQDIVSSQHMLTEALKQKVKEKISGYVDKAVQLAKETNCDLFDVIKELKKYHYREYREFRDKYTVDSVIPMLEVECSVKVVERL